MRGFQHCVGLADAGGVAQEDLEAPPAVLLLVGPDQVE